MRVMLNLVSRFSAVYARLTPGLDFVDWFVDKAAITLMWECEMKLDADDSSKTQIRFYVDQTSLKNTDSFLSNFLNRLTSFNQVMTQEEKVMRHQMRSRFVLLAVNRLAEACDYLRKGKTLANLIKSP